MRSMFGVMADAITNLASSVSGSPAASNAEVRRKRREEEHARRARRAFRDVYEPRVSETERINADRSVEDATQEEAREDRVEHARDMAGRDASENPGLDLHA